MALDKVLAAIPSRLALFRGAGWVLLYFSTSRLLICGIILLSQMIILKPRAHPAGLASVLTGWDGGWYLEIVRHGYRFSPTWQSTMGFFPFYPILVRIGTGIFRDPVTSALLISNFCLLAAGILLNFLVRSEYPDERVSRAAVAFLMFSPVSFFFSSAYTESTFLLLAIGAFLAASKQKWLLACLCGMVLSATRAEGVLITIPLAVEFVIQRWRTTPGVGALITPRVLLLALNPLGLLFFMLFSYVTFHDYFAYMHAKAVSGWNVALVPPWRTFANAQKNLGPFYLWLYEGGLLVGVLLCMAGIYFKIRVSYLVWMTLSIITYVCSNNLVGVPRYLSTIFPIFIVLGLLASRFKWSFEPLLAGSIALLTICTIMFANGYAMT